MTSIIKFRMYLARKIGVKFETCDPINIYNSSMGLERNGMS